MEQSDQRRHASSFGAAAVSYAEHRPDYAQAAVRWALEGEPGVPEEEREALLRRSRAFLAGTPETARGEFTLPMRTGVLRVRRL
ncbi:hypothetical protein ACIRL3_22805 [Streptomyces sp. NPDC102384]|uniref:hypothetical protein n=1 Tax=Streptomyces sp. NPDC102384 TaxID=3366166 RepID=UPI0037F50D04